MKPAWGASLVVLLAVSTARADDPRFAVDRFEPSERGSMWLANDSLDFGKEGEVLPTLGAVMSWSKRSVNVGKSAPLDDNLILHLGGSAVALEHFRLAFDLPLQIYADGHSAGAYQSPPRAQGIGDLRLSFDTLLYGDSRGLARFAMGVSAWIPTGDRSQWTSDESLRVRPRVSFAGEKERFVYGANIGFALRETTDIGIGLAGGYLVTDTIVLGPEIMMSTTFDDFFGEPSTPFEVLLGGHWLASPSLRVGGGIGHGFTPALGSPDFRGILTVEWLAPDVSDALPGALSQKAPDADRDGVPDTEDACPRVMGMKTSDPKTNGCPLDSDSDGVDDMSDACPTIAGIHTEDPATNGCPDMDRDHDGITNEEDACPSEAGPRDLDPRKNGCPKAYVRGPHIEMREQIKFVTGRPTILVTDKDTLEVLFAVMQVLKDRTDIHKLHIEGHTDSHGDPFANKALSLARAQAVAKWLVEHGIVKERLVSEGFGGERPVETNETEAGRSVNRRVELRVE